MNVVPEKEGFSLQGECAGATLKRRLALTASDANYVIMNNYRGARQLKLQDGIYETKWQPTL